MVKRLLLATSNPHKLGEVRAVFAAEPGGPPVELVSLSDLGVSAPEPVEDADTFEGNAVLKARYYAEAAGLGCLADDSGLEVDALGGEPGVRSARYSGATGSRAEVDEANNRRLLAELGDRPAAERGARFVCAMAWCEPGEPEPRAVVRGTVEGRILLPGEAADPDAPHRGRGSNGFGYDPLFLRPESGRTTAELSPAEKNAVSHRGEAARAMARRLREAAAG